MDMDLTAEQIEEFGLPCTEGVKKNEYVTVGHVLCPRSGPSPEEVASFFVKGCECPLQASGWYKDRKSVRKTEKYHSVLIFKCKCSSKNDGKNDAVAKVRLVLPVSEYEKSKDDPRAELEWEIQFMNNPIKYQHSNGVRLNLKGELKHKVKIGLRIVNIQPYLTASFAGEAIDIDISILA